MILNSDACPEVKKKEENKICGHKYKVSKYLYEFATNNMSIRTNPDCFVRANYQ